MSALAEALVAAQRRALTAMEKQYVASKIDADTLRGRLQAIGLTDEIDIDRLTWALDTIKVYGADLPSEPTNGATEKPTDKATDAQLALIAKLVQEKNQTPPDPPLTKADAHTIIDSLKAGTYDVAKWTVPF